MDTVLMAMSGGVDSSVAAALLKKKGYRVIGASMKLFDPEKSHAGDTLPSCNRNSQDRDIEDARKVCARLDIPFHVIDVSSEYRRHVLDYVNMEYLRGRTPNPCLVCNPLIKFGAFVARALESGLEFDLLATGHYARIASDTESGRYVLKKGIDQGKDQSYFLSRLSQEQLARILFPVGEFTKEEVKELSRKMALGAEERPESQDFFKDGVQVVFGDAKPGPLIDKDGALLGTHRGVPYYTVGQRRGLGISSEQPLYVTEIDAGKNTVTVGGRNDVYGKELNAIGMNWVSIDPPDKEIRVNAKIRYLHQDAPATIVPINAFEIHLEFDTPQLAITPGQGVVLYRGDIVLAGGIIEKSGGR